MNIVETACAEEERCNKQKVVGAICKEFDGVERMMNKKMNGQERRQLRLEDVVKHDTLIHSIGFNPTDYQLSLDLDWIIRAEIKSGRYEYHLSPSTLILENVWDVRFDLESNLSLTVDEVRILSQSRPKNADCLRYESQEYMVLIECLGGSIQFRTIGGRVFKRTPECMGMDSSLSVSERGGFSLQPVGEEFEVGI